MSLSLFYGTVRILFRTPNHSQVITGDAGRTVPPPLLLSGDDLEAVPLVVHQQSLTAPPPLQRFEAPLAPSALALACHGELFQKLLNAASLDFAPDSNALVPSEHPDNITNGKQR